MIPVLIVGGGLAGLVTSILLGRAGVEVLLLEKKEYPFHKVCGEYVSNEVIGFLKAINAFPDEMGLPRINRLLISSTSGNTGGINLALGGFGISRYAFDEFLYKRAMEEGVSFKLNTAVTEIQSRIESHVVTTDRGEQFQARLVVGAYGKRSQIDYGMERKFTKQRAPFVGVKYHIKTDLPPNQISLHNFQGGYCGISKIEEDYYNLCYLSSRENLKQFKNVKTMEEQVLYANPRLKELFLNSDFVFEKPEVINEISFAAKGPVTKGVMMAGDSAGLITPLCGNGMAMAIHSGKILAETILENFTGKELDTNGVGKGYARGWSKTFARRLWVGRKAQNLFGGDVSSSLSIGLLRYIKPVAETIISKTHGQPF